MRAPRGRGQALAELALVLPLILVLGFGSIGVGRVVQARMGLSAATREAARAAALAELPPGGSRAEAEERGERRGRAVAQGYGLNGVALRVSAAGFDPGSWVRAEASYTVGQRDLPLLGWRGIRLESSHVERVDPYRSRTP